MHFDDDGAVGTYQCINLGSGYIVSSPRSCCIIIFPSSVLMELKAFLRFGDSIRQTQSAAASAAAEWIR